MPPPGAFCFFDTHESSLSMNNKTVTDADALLANTERALEMMQRVYLTLPYLNAAPSSSGALFPPWLARCCCHGAQLKKRVVFAHFQPSCRGGATMVTQMQTTLVARLKTSSFF